MKLIKMVCPNCNASVEVNSEFETAVCNYCGTEFYVKDEDETKEERILKTKAKIDERAHDSERKYYASEEYQKKVDIENETKLERIVRKIGDSNKKRREYDNSPEGKREMRNVYIFLAVFFGSAIILAIVASIFFSNRELKCSLNNKEYNIIIKKNKKISCASCDDDMLKTLNDRYLDKDSTDITSDNVENYFINLGGTCNSN